MHNAPQAAPIAVVADLKCAVSLCARRFHTVKELVSHLNDHIGEGRSVLWGYGYVTIGCH